jgi:hypothetical protein
MKDETRRNIFREKYQSKKKLDPFSRGQWPPSVLQTDVLVWQVGQAAGKQLSVQDCFQLLFC